jgi:hypoxanthine phosphoribosyltransferase
MSGMGMSMSMGHYLRQEQRLEQKIVVSMTNIDWSLVNAYRKGSFGPPPYVEPTFGEEVFTPHLKLEHRRIENFETLGHETRMRLVDEANAMFRFDYVRGRDEYDSGKEKYYFKIPLLRDFNLSRDIDKIKIRIARAEYERTTALLKAVGEMERIARAIPYYGLYQSVTAHLRKQHNVGLDEAVLVAIDRGGRIPCLVLMHALGHTTMQTLKVDQGGGRLDEDRLKEFVAQRTLQDKHALLVDSTVDSGRQIGVLEQYFEQPSWRSRLQHRSWSVVGSNDWGKSLEHHHNVNWGVDPDRTFEDDPALMGIDYAQGSHTKVVECPSEASEAIRKCLLAVPAGYIYAPLNIEEQVKQQYTQWRERQKQRRKKHRATVSTGRAEHRKEATDYRKQQAEQKAHDDFERLLARITAAKRWQTLKTRHKGLPTETLPAVAANGTAHALHNVLVVGSGKLDLPAASAQFVADKLGPHCSFFAGTPDGNPGAVLKATLQSSRVPQPEVRLYQPQHMQQRGDATFGGVPVVFVGPDKEDMRRQMITDAHVVLALGGAEGTLREVLLSIRLGKPTILIEGYGPVAAYVLGTPRWRRQGNVKRCTGLVEAVQTILDISKV